MKFRVEIYTLPFLLLISTLLIYYIKLLYLLWCGVGLCELYVKIF